MGDQSMVVLLWEAGMHTSIIEDYAFFLLGRSTHVREEHWICLCCQYDRERRSKQEKELALIYLLSYFFFDQGLDDTVEPILA